MKSKNKRPAPRKERPASKGISLQTYPTLDISDAQEILDDFQEAKMIGLEALELVAIRAIVTIAVLEDALGGVSVNLESTKGGEDVL